MAGRGRFPALLALALALAGCQMPTPDTPAAAASQAEPRIASPAALTALLPAEAAGFRRGATAPLPAGEGGHETGYRTPGRTAAGAAVELFRPAGGPVPDGAESPAVDAAFAELLRDALRPAPHRQLRDHGRLTLPGGLRCAETTGVYGRERVQGLLCAGGIGGSVLRLRVTMPQRDPAPADAKAFASGILAALRAP